MQNKTSPATECAEEKAIRDRMVAANYAGQFRQVYEAITELNQHNKSCPVCTGALVSSLFGGVKVEVVG